MFWSTSTRPKPSISKRLPAAGFEVPFKPSCLIPGQQLTVENEEHPAVDLLELFALCRLKAEEMWNLLRHLDSCATCREALRSEYEYVEAIRAALRRLE